MKKDNSDEIIFLIICIIPVVWMALLFAPYMNKGLLNVFMQMNDAFSDPLAIIWCRDSLRTVAVFLIAYVCSVGIYISNRKNYRRKEEYGSAKWANTKTVNKKYEDKTFQKNKILSQNVRIGLDGKKHRRNLNTIVIGGSGAGKTRFYGKPNLMQCNTSFVVLDPKGGARRSYMKSVRTSQI